MTQPHGSHKSIWRALLVVNTKGSRSVSLIHEYLGIYLIVLSNAALFQNINVHLLVQFVMKMRHRRDNMSKRGRHLYKVTIRLTADCGMYLPLGDDKHRFVRDNSKKAHWKSETKSMNYSF